MFFASLFSKGLVLFLARFSFLFCNRVLFRFLVLQGFLCKGFSFVFPKVSCFAMFFFLQSVVFFFFRTWFCVFFFVPRVLCFFLLLVLCYFFLILVMRLFFLVLFFKELFFFKVFLHRFHVCQRVFFLSFSSLHKVGFSPKQLFFISRKINFFFTKKEVFFFCQGFSKRKKILQKKNAHKRRRGFQKNEFS